MFAIDAICCENQLARTDISKSDALLLHEFTRALKEVQLYTRKPPSWLREPGLIRFHPRAWQQSSHTATPFIKIRERLRADFCPTSSHEKHTANHATPSRVNSGVALLPPFPPRKI